MQTWKDVSDTLLRSWRARGYTVDAVQKLTKIPLEVLQERYYRLYCTETVADPTPLEIKQRCAEIQREWSDSERRRRAVYSNGEWTPTVVPASVLTLASSSADGCTAWYGRTRHSATSSESTATRRGRAG
jgi:hypothetical protein